jgi:hypothetical protein
VLVRSIAVRSGCAPPVLDGDPPRSLSNPQRLRSCLGNVASAGKARRTATGNQGVHGNTWGLRATACRCSDQEQSFFKQLLKVLGI